MSSGHQRDKLVTELGKANKIPQLCQISIISAILYEIFKLLCVHCSRMF